VSFVIYPQLQALPGPQVISLRPVSAETIMADAQPTPLFTLMAAAGQFIWQAPHSMQATGLTSKAFLSPGVNTPCGQTSQHMPQLMHRSESYKSEFSV
jgi:hypothetical protein